MKAIKELLGDSIIYGIGSLFVRATQIFILPLILFYLQKDEFGILDYFLSIKNVFVILFGWGILTSIFKFSNNLGKKDKSPFNGIIIIFTVSVLVFCLIILFSFFINSINDHWEDIINVHLIATFGALLTIPLAVFRLIRKPINYIILNLIYTLILLTTSYYLVINTNYSYKSVLYGHVLASSISFFIGIISVKKHIDFKVDFTLMKEMLNFGFSILLSSLSFVILLATTRFFLKAQASFEDIGILGMAQRISLFVGAILISPFALAWLPFVKSKANEVNFPIITNRVFTSFLWIGLLFTFTLELIQKDIFILIGNEEYLPALKYVMPFSLSYLLQGLYFIFSAGIFLSGNTKQYKIIGLSSILFNLFLYLIMFQHLTIGVVSYITLSSFLFVVVLSYLFGNTKIKINVFSRRNISILVLYTILIGLLFSSNNYNYEISLGSQLILKLTFVASLFLYHLFIERRVRQVGQS